MSVTIPTTPQFSKKITREQALDMYHNPQKYVDFYNENNATLPKEKNDMGWPQFLKNPERYKRNLLGFGLGFGIEDADGDWMTAYKHDIPIKELLKRKHKPTEVRTRKKDPVRLKQMKKELLSMTRSQYKGIDHPPRPHEPTDKFYSLSERIEGLERKIGDVEKSGGFMVWVQMEAILAHPESYFDFLECDEPYFREALKVHQQLLNRDNPLAMLKQENPSLFHDKFNAKQLREMTAAVMGESASPLEGQEHAIGDLMYIISKAEVVKNDAGVPYLMHALEPKGKGSTLPLFLVQDVRQGHIDAYHTRELSSGVDIRCRMNLEIALDDINKELQAEFPLKKTETEKPDIQSFKPTF